MCTQLLHTPGGAQPLQALGDEDRGFQEIPTRAGQMQCRVERSSLTNDISPAHKETNHNYRLDVDKARIESDHLWASSNQHTDRNGDGRIRTNNLRFKVHPETQPWHTQKVNTPGGEYMALPYGMDYI